MSKYLAELMLAAALLLSATMAQAQEINGLKIGDPLNKISIIGLKPTAQNRVGPFQYLKWELPNGNELSITVRAQDETIVYLEMDWGGKQEGAVSDIPNFTYGVTSLSDIRRAAGTNGLAYSGRAPVFKIPDGSKGGYSNSYELANSSVDVTFITKRDLKPSMTESEMTDSSKALLDSVIIGDRTYLHSTWGKPMMFDNGYQPIDLLKVSSSISAGLVTTKSPNGGVTPVPNQASKPQRDRASAEGTWAKSSAECEDEEGPNSRTLIDLEDPKVGPIFDQYENHCRIRAAKKAGRGVKLSLTCYEFWDNFEKRKEGRATTAVLQQKAVNRLAINGSQYIRCAE